MVTGWMRARTMVMALALAGTGLTALPQAAHAQDAEARLRKIEAEVRALQRTVFPGGDGRYFTPEVPTPDQASGGSGAPATSAVTDILARLDSMELQLQRLTGQTEENTNAIGQLSLRLDAIEAAARTPVVEAPALVTPTPAPVAVATPAPAPVRATPAPTPVPTPVPAPTAARVAAVRAIVKPATADAGDDEYTYGFRLWEARFYPEAQQQLQLFLQKYPRHAQVSKGRNLLGRAFLDDGKPDEAATWFVNNYTTDAAGDRAPDSVLFLAEAMILKGDTKRACLALAEFGEVYPAIASGRLQAQYRAASSKVKCN